MKLENLDFTALKAACAALNDAEGLLEKAELGKIKTVAVKKETLVENFTKAIEGISGAGAEEDLPEVAVDMYNLIYAEDADDSGGGDGGGEDSKADKAADKAAKAAEKKKKAEEKAAEKKAKAAAKRSVYGHILSAISGKMDVMLAEGTTFGAICDELEVNRSRIKSHIKALKNKGLTVMVKENEDWKKTTVSVKEKSV